MPITCQKTTAKDSAYISTLMTQSWGGEPLIIRGQNYFPSQLPGILAKSGDNVVGFLSYELQGQDCEIIVFDAFEKFKGTGTKLLELCKDIAKEQGCKRIYLLTHNDNLDALRFYQRRGFHICGIHLNVMDHARKLKPCIPEQGDYGIPIRDEIDLELLL